MLVIERSIAPPADLVSTNMPGREPSLELIPHQVLWRAIGRETPPPDEPPQEPEFENGPPNDPYLAFLGRVANGIEKLPSEKPDQAPAPFDYFAVHSEDRGIVPDRPSTKPVIDPNHKLLAPEVELFGDRKTREQYERGEVPQSTQYHRNPIPLEAFVPREETTGEITIANLKVAETPPYVIAPAETTLTLPSPIDEATRPVDKYSYLNWGTSVATDSSMELPIYRGVLNDTIQIPKVGSEKEGFSGHLAVETATQTVSPPDEALPVWPTHHDDQ